jgi:replicative DNA helicase
MIDQTKKPPSSVDTENGILGCCLRHGALPEMALVLTPDDFYSDANRKIFACMLSLDLVGKKPTPLTVGEELVVKFGFDQTVYLHVGSLWDAWCSPRDAADNWQTIKNKAGLRALQKAALDILHEIDIPSMPDADVLEYAEKQVYEIGQSRQMGMKSETLAKVMNDGADAIDRQIQAAKEGRRGATGMLSGFTDLDNITGGFKDGQLIVIGARPGIGKSTLALNMFYNAAVIAGTPAAVFSLEMANPELAEKFYAMDTEIDSYLLRHGYLSVDEQMKIASSREKYQVAKSWLCDLPSANMTQIRSEVRRLRSKDKIRMVIVDYLQLVAPENRRDQRHLQIGEITRQLKLLAKEMAIPVIAISQLNRQGEDRLPRLSDMRESGNIEMDADTVIFLHDPNHNDYAANDAVRNDALDVIVAKNRNGPTGKTQLIFKRPLSRFFNAAAGLP